MNREVVSPDRENKMKFTFELVLAVFAVLGFFAASYYPFSKDWQWLADVLKILSAGAGVSAIVAMVQSWYSSKDIRVMLGDTRSDLERLLRDTSSLVRNAQDYGIKRIGPPRFATRYSNGAREFCDRMKQELTEARLRSDKEDVVIKIMGITLFQFFGGEIQNEMRDACTHSRITVQILVLDPIGREAILRAEREAQASQVDSQYVYTPQDHKVSSLYTDFCRCVRSMPQADYKKGRQDSGTRLYTLAPSCQLVFINDSVFVENYYYGRRNDNSGGGGRVPVLEFDRTSETYRELEGHFDYVWNKSIRQKLTSTTRQMIINITPHELRDLAPDIFPPASPTTPLTGSSDSISQATTSQVGST